MKGESKLDETRLTFGQFEPRLGRNKSTEVVVGAGVGGDKSWRWRFREAWLRRLGDINKWIPED